MGAVVCVSLVSWQYLEYTERYKEDERLVWTLISSYLRKNQSTSKHRSAGWPCESLNKKGRHTRIFLAPQSTAGKLEPGHICPQQAVANKQCMLQYVTCHGRKRQQSLLPCKHKMCWNSEKGLKSCQILRKLKPHQTFTIHERKTFLIHK